METMFMYVFMYVAKCVLVYGMTSTVVRQETKITQAQLNSAKGVWLLIWGHGDKFNYICQFH